MARADRWCRRPRLRLNVAVAVVRCAVCCWTAPPARVDGVPSLHGDSPGAHSSMAEKSSPPASCAMPSSPLVPSMPPSPGAALSIANPSDSTYARQPRLAHHNAPPAGWLHQTQARRCELCYGAIKSTTPWEGLVFPAMEAHSNLISLSQPYQFASWLKAVEPLVSWTQISIWFFLHQGRNGSTRSLFFICCWSFSLPKSPVTFPILELKSFLWALFFSIKLNCKS